MGIADFNHLCTPINLVPGFSEENWSYERRRQNTVYLRFGDLNSDKLNHLGLTQLGLAFYQYHTHKQWFLYPGTQPSSSGIIKPLRDTAGQDPRH